MKDKEDKRLRQFCFVSLGSCWEDSALSPPFVPPLSPMALLGALQAKFLQKSKAAAANAGLFAMPQQRADTTQTRFMPHISDLPTEDGLHRAFRGRLTVADFVAGDALLDIVRPRMCVGCGGIQRLGGSAG